MFYIFTKFIIYLMLRFIWPPNHIYTFLGTRIYTQITIHTLRHINSKSWNYHFLLCIMRSFSTIKLRSLCRLNCVNLNTINRTSSFTLKASNAVIYVNMQPRPNIIIFTMFKTYISFWLRPFFIRILQCCNIFLFINKMIPC